MKGDGGGTALGTDRAVLETACCWGHAGGMPVPLRAPPRMAGWPGRVAVLTRSRPALPFVFLPPHSATPRHDSQGGLFHFELLIPPRYPVCPPRVFLATPTPPAGAGIRLHPHLPARPGGLLDHPVLAAATWSPAESLRGVLLAVQALLSARRGHPELGFHSLDEEGGGAAPGAARTGSVGPATALPAGGTAAASAGAPRSPPARVSAAAVAAACAAAAAPPPPPSGTPAAAPAAVAAAAADGAPRSRSPLRVTTATVAAAGAAVAAPPAPAGGAAAARPPGPPTEHGERSGGGGGSPALPPPDAASGAALEGLDGAAAAAASPPPPEVITDAASAAATATCLEWAVIAAVAPAVLRGSALAAPTARAFLLFYDTYVAAVAAGEAYGRAHPDEQRPAASRWTTLRAGLDAAYGRLLAAVSRPGWSFSRPPADAASRAAAATAFLTAEAAALAAHPPPGVVSAAPRNAEEPYVWDAVVVGAAAPTTPGETGAGDGDQRRAACAVPLLVEVVAAADHPTTAPWVRFAPAARVWHPNVSPVGGVPAVGAALGAAEGAAGGAPSAAGWAAGGAATAAGTIAGALAAVARLLAAPDPRWAVNAEAAAAHRLDAAAFWARFHRAGGGDA